MHYGNMADSKISQQTVVPNQPMQPELTPQIRFSRAGFNDEALGKVRSGGCKEGRSRAERAFGEVIASRSNSQLLRLAAAGSRRDAT